MTDWRFLAAVGVYIVLIIVLVYVLKKVLVYICIFGGWLTVYIVNESEKEEAMWRRIYARLRSRSNRHP
jgi:hypothetical protein